MAQEYAAPVVEVSALLYALDVSELGDLLELVHGSRESFRTFHGRYALWRDEGAYREAFQAAAEAAEAETSTVVFASSGPAREVDGPPRETEWRIWLEPPDRIREEFDDHSFGHPVAVAVGERWWTYDRWNGAITNEGEEDVESDVGESYSAWFAPAALLGSLVFEPLGSGEVAGRPTVNARAIRPRPINWDDDDVDWGPAGLGIEADEYELALDAERGVILRLEARHGGRPFFIGEAEAVGFDEPLPDGTFVFRPPEGEEVRALHDPEPELELTIEEIVERATFPVFVPARVPENWRFHSIFVEAQDRPPRPESVSLLYAAEDGTASVTITEHAVGAVDEDDDEPMSEDAPPLERVARDGVTIEVRGRTAAWPQSTLTLVRQGTRISMYSEHLPGETLVELAAKLVPARREPPRF